MALLIVWKDSTSRANALIGLPDDGTSTLRSPRTVTPPLVLILLALMGPLTVALLTVMLLAFTGPLVVKLLALMGPLTVALLAVMLPLAEILPVDVMLPPSMVPVAVMALALIVPLLAAMLPLVVMGPVAVILPPWMAPVAFTALALIGPVDVMFPPWMVPVAVRLLVLIVPLLAAILPLVVMPPVGVSMTTLSVPLPCRATIFSAPNETLAKLVPSSRSRCTSSVALGTVRAIPPDTYACRTPASTIATVVFPAAVLCTFLC